VYDSHVSSLLEFPARGTASLYRLQCDLLRNAREHAGVIESTNDPRVTKDEIVLEEHVKTVSDRARDATLGKNPRDDTVFVERPSGLAPHADAAPLQLTMKNLTLMNREDEKVPVEDIPGVDEEEDDEEEDDGEDDDEITQIFLSGGTGIPIGPDGVPRPLLPSVAPQHVGRKCLVLDLDETLVHSAFKVIQQADFVVPVEIEYQWHNVYVTKRPGVDNFLKKMGQIYEIVVFTASLGKYVDPVLDKLDVHHVIAHRLFRESCYSYKGNYVKDLSHLGRPLADTIILDNSPASYIFHPNNAVPISTWFNDAHDTDLTDLCHFLADLSTVDDVRQVLDGNM